MRNEDKLFGYPKYAASTSIVERLSTHGWNEGVAGAGTTIFVIDYVSDLDVRKTVVASSRAWWQVAAHGGKWPRMVASGRRLGDASGERIGYACIYRGSSVSGEHYQINSLSYF
jgi:hypothetical protein